MVMPTIFTDRANSISASYDWFDFAANAGYKLLYATGMENSAAETFVLTPEAIMSDAHNTGTTDLGAGTHEFNFDITFNSPVTVAAADAFVCCYLSSTGAGVNTSVRMTVFHVSTGAVETSLGTETSRIVNNAAYSPVSFNFALTKKAFAIGEKLRLCVELIVTANFGDIRWDTTGTYPLKLYVPFKVEL